MNNIELFFIPDKISVAKPNCASSTDTNKVLKCQTKADSSAGKADYKTD